MSEAINAPVPAAGATQTNPSPADTTTPTTPAVEATNQQDQLPEWARKQITDANREAENYRKKLRAFEQEQATKQEATLAEQGKYKELYEASQTKLKEFEPLAERLTKYEQALNVQIEQGVKNWSDGLKKVVLAETDLERRQALYEQLKPEAEKRMPPALGTPLSPRPAPGRSLAENNTQAYQQMREEYRRLA